MYHIGVIHDLEKLLPKRVQRIEILKKNELVSIIQAQNKTTCNPPRTMTQESSEVKTFVLESVGKPSSTLLQQS